MLFAFRLKFNLCFFFFVFVFQIFIQSTFTGDTIKMGIRSRGLVFATFFGNCVIVGLLVASLTTDHWIVGHAKHKQSANATGRINFGLFSGKQVLNVGLGPRASPIDVRARMNTEPNFMSWWLWLGAFIGTGLGLFSSAVAAIASVLKSASEAKKHGTMVLLFVSNSASGEFDTYLRFERMRIT